TARLPKHLWRGRARLEYWLRSQSPNRPGRHRLGDPSGPLCVPTFQIHLDQPAPEFSDHHARLRFRHVQLRSFPDCDYSRMKLALLQTPAFPVGDLAHTSTKFKKIRNLRIRRLRSRINGAGYRASAP